MNSATNDDHTAFFFPHHVQGINTKILLSAVISLSLVILLVVALHIYARIILRRQSLQRVVFNLPNPGDSTQIPLPEKGLSPEVITSLPILKLTNQDPGECAVCLGDLKDLIGVESKSSDFARVLPNCKHSFHVGCIDIWLRSNTTCPMCRTEVLPRKMKKTSRARVEGVETREVGVGLELRRSESAKVESSGNLGRLSSFTRMLSWERSRSVPRRFQDASRDVESG